MLCYFSPQGPLSDYPYDGTLMWLFDPSGNPNNLFRFVIVTESNIYLELNHHPSLTLTG